MKYCSAINRAGERCRGMAVDGGDLCYHHNPKYESARNAAAKKGGKKGGRGRPLVETNHLRLQLQELYEAIKEGTIKPGVGSVLVQVTNTQLRVIDTEMKIREMTEMEERLAQLEEHYERSEARA